MSVDAIPISFVAMRRSASEPVDAVFADFVPFVMLLLQLSVVLPEWVGTRFVGELRFDDVHSITQLFHLGWHVDSVIRKAVYALNRLWIIKRFGSVIEIYNYYKNEWAGVLTCLGAKRTSRCIGSWAATWTCGNRSCRSIFCPRPSKASIKRGLRPRNGNQLPGHQSKERANRHDMLFRLIGHWSFVVGTHKKLWWVRVSCNHTHRK